MPCKGNGLRGALSTDPKENTHSDLTRTARRSINSPTNESNFFQKDIQPHLRKNTDMAIPILHLTANCSSFFTTLTAQTWCVISRLNLSNFKFQPLGFIMLLSASLKSCHWCFSASIIFQCVIPDPFPSYA